MRIVILGTGRMGGALARALKRETLHELSLRGSTLTSPSAKALAGALDIPLASAADIASADVVFVAVHWSSIEGVASALKGYTGTVVSTIVPWDGQGDPRTGNASAAEALAHLIPQATVATAFTTIASALLDTPSKGEPPSVFICSDDMHASSVVTGIVQELRFDAVNGGTLQNSRYVEDMGLLCLHLAYGAGYTNRVSFRLYVAP